MHRDKIRVSFRKSFGKRNIKSGKRHHCLIKFDNISRPNSGDCTIPTPDALPYADRSDPLMISTSSSEVYPWSTIQQDTVHKEILPDRVTPPRPPTPSSWLPSSAAPSSGRIPSTDASSTQILGSRTRPASYGRASSWSSENTPPVGGNTVQMYPELPSTPSTRSDWATVRAWNVGGQAPANIPSKSHIFLSICIY